MVRVPFEIRGEEGSFEVVVRTGSMRRAAEDLRLKYPGCEVRPVFPIDGEEFFASGGEREEPAAV